MGLSLDNALQLTFGLLALLTAIIGTYVTWKLTTGIVLPFRMNSVDVRLANVVARSSWTESQFTAEKLHILSCGIVACAISF